MGKRLLQNCYYCLRFIFTSLCQTPVASLPPLTARTTMTIEGYYHVFILATLRVSCYFPVDKRVFAIVTNEVGKITFFIKFVTTVIMCYCYL